jgi:hypothetical protein
MVRRSRQKSHLAAVRAARDDGGVSESRAASAPEVAERREPWHRHLQSWLANPLLVTMVSAVLIYLVIPQLTRGWQNHQKILDVKTGLVGDMSDSVSNALMSGRFIASGLIGKATSDPFATQRAFNTAYQDWTTKSAVTGAQLAAYFPGSDLSDRWRAYADAVADYLQVGVRGQFDDRVNQLTRLVKFLPALHPKDRKWWGVLLERSPAGEFQQNYAELSAALQAERDVLVQRVLETKATGF